MVKADKAVQKLVKYIKNEQLLEPGDKVILACSGGADSLALLMLFAQIRPAFKLSLLVLHFNHQTRGEANDREAALVRSYCQSLNIPLVVRKLGPFASSDFENQARIARFKEFDHIQKLYKFDKIALAHHKNDQAETVLLNLFRGSGISGMGGIKPLIGSIIHPLLGFSRAELREYLVQNNKTWEEDESNLDNSHRRNYLRNELFPLLEEHVSPAVVDRINLQASISRKADQLLKEKSLKHFKKLVLEQYNNKLVLDSVYLKKLKEIEQYYVLKRVYSSLTGRDQDFFWHSFESVMTLLDSGGSKQTVLQHDLNVYKQYDELIFSLPETPGQETKAEALILEEDRARAVFMDYRFSFKYIKVLPRDWAEDRHVVYLDSDKICFPITIRSRKPGDRFCPKGMTNSKKLKDFFIDEKVPKFDRDKIAVFTDTDKIIWIAGLRADQRVCPDETSTHFLQITAESIHEKPKRAASRIKKQGENYESDEL